MQLCTIFFIVNASCLQILCVFSSSLLEAYSVDTHCRIKIANTAKEKINKRPNSIEGEYYGSLQSK